MIIVNIILKINYNNNHKINIELSLHEKLSFNKKLITYLNITLDVKKIS